MCRAFLFAPLLLLLSGCGNAVRLDVVSDECLKDAQKVYPGTCGCGVPEDRCVPLKDALIHRYAFDGSGPVAVDDVGHADGSIINTELTGSGQLRLDRRADLEQYVALPNGIISSLTSATFEAWVIWETPPVDPPPFWERIFDFGVSTAGEDQRDMGASYIFLAPGQSTIKNPSQPRTAFRDLALGAEVVVDGGDPCPFDTVFHIAVVVDARSHELRLYLNGLEGGRAPLSEPLSAIEDVNNWLGRSQFIKDTRFGGSFLEFRIYQRALTPGELADSLALGPSPYFLQTPAQDGNGAP